MELGDGFRVPAGPLPEELVPLGGVLEDEGGGVCEVAPVPCWPEVCRGGAGCGCGGGGGCCCCGGCPPAGGCLGFPLAANAKTPKATEETATINT